MGTVEQKIGALQAAIKEGENSINSLSEKIKSYDEQAKQAFQSGDTAGFNAITADIVEQSKNLQDLVTEVEGYKASLSTLEGAMDITQGMTEAPKLFTSQEDYDYVQSLKESVSDLRGQIADFDGADADLASLRMELQQQEDELRACEDAAASLAAHYGTELGNKAAEASEHFYSLQSAIEGQQATCERLQESVNQAKQALDELTASGDASDQAIQQAQGTYEAFSIALQSATNELYNLQAAQKDASATWSQVQGEMTQADSTLVKLLGGQDNFNKILGNLPPVAQSAIKGITGMTGAAKAFIATPIGAIIAAIVVVLQTLNTWLHSSEEGERALSEVTGYFSGILTQLKEIVITVGKAIYQAFSDPKKAVNELWKIIKENLVNRIEGLGGIFVSLGKLMKDVFTGEWGSIGDDFKGLTNEVMKTATGVDNLSGKMKNYVNSVNDAAKATSKLAKRQFDLDRQKSKWQNEEAKLDNKISELRNKIYSSQGTEKQKALADVQELINQKYEKRIEFAKEQLAIQQETNALSTNSKADYEAEEKYQAELTALEGQRETEKRMIIRQEAMMNRKETSQAKTEENKQEQIANKLLELKRSNQSDELALMEEGSAKVLKQIEKDYDDRVSTVLKKAKEFAKANKEAGIGGSESFTSGDTMVTGLTTEQTSALQESLDNAERIKQKAVTDEQQSELQAMRDYLKEYGTFQQQKLAIAQEYAEKIKKATTEGEKLSLQKELDRKMQNIEVSAITADIDWKSVLGEFGTMFQDSLKPTLDKLKAYTQSDEFRQAETDDQKKIYDLITQLEQQTSSGWKGMFKDMGDAVNTYKDKQAKLAQASEDAAKATEAYKNALAMFASGQITQEQLDDFTRQMVESGDKVSQSQDEVTAAQDSMTAAATRVKDNMDNLASGLKDLQSGSLSGVWKGVKELAGVFGDKDFSQKVANVLSKTIGGTLGEVLGGPLGGQILDGAFEILDLLANGIENLFSNLIDTVLNAVNGILDTALNGKIVTSVFNSVKSGVGNILSTLSFGALGNWSGSNAKYVQEVTDTLTKSNEQLANSVDKLREEITKTSGSKAISSATEAMQAQEAVIENTRQILMTQMGYHGSHHSNAYYWNLSDSDYANLNQTLSEYAQANGTAVSKVKSLSDIYTLTPEEMDYIRTHNLDMWNLMLDQGKYDKSEYWEQFADLAGSLSDISDELKESLTQTSFDSLRSSFIDSLMDMDKSASDFSDDFKDYLMQAILNAKISDLMDDELQSFYDKWADYAYSDNELTQSEMDELTKEWDALAEKGLAIRDQIAEITGYDSTYSQSASAKTYESMSEDTASELNGRFTALQVAGEEIRNQAVRGVVLLESIFSLDQDRNGTLNDILVQNVITNSHLEDIAKYTKPLLNINDKLDKIINNTNNL
jgi:hypothetical protein